MVANSKKQAQNDKIFTKARPICLRRKLKRKLP